MNSIGLFLAARDLQEFCNEQNWRACIIGGLAVQRWGETRVTRDIDITVLTGFGHEDSFIEILLARYEARVVDAGRFAMRSRVLLVKTPEGIGIDVALGGLPFEELVVGRATDYEFAPGITLRTCSAEDLVVMKLFASRALDIRDAESVAVRHQKTLDWGYIEQQLAPLVELKEEPEIMQELARIRNLGSTL